MFDYWLWDSVLPKWFCEEQIKNTNWKEKEQGTILKGTESIIDETQRITDVVWVSEESPIGCVCQVYINLANQKAGWNFNLTNNTQVQIGKYNGDTKGFYDWHNDDGFKTNQNGLVRKLSVSILLSDENSFEGGEFEFKNFEQQPVLKQGSILVFPSTLEHRVKPVTSGTRYSAVTWVSGPAYR